MASDSHALSRPPLSLLIAVALLGWGVAGYAFYAAGGDREATEAKLAQTEAARAGLADELEHLRSASGQLADLQQKITAAEAELTKTQANAAEVAQNLTKLNEEVAARTHDRDVLKAQADAAKAASPGATPAHSTAAQKAPSHKTTP
jgi:chromosome segregation ATPase